MRSTYQLLELLSVLNRYLNIIFNSNVQLGININ